MARSVSNTKIILEQNGAFDRPTYERVAADGNILPGHLLVMNASGQVARAGAGHTGPWMVAQERQYVPGDLTAGAALSTAYPSGERVPFMYVQPGDLVQLIAGASQNLAVGDVVEAAANGQVVERSTGARVGTVEEAVTTGAGATARVKIRIG